MELLPSSLYRSKRANAKLSGTDLVQDGAPESGMKQASNRLAGVSELRRNFLVGREAGKKGTFAPAVFEQPIQLYSPAFYAVSTVGGILSCGTTHTLVTPLDVIKCNMQVDPKKFKSIPSSFSLILREQGVKGLFIGWVPTLMGYSAQGAGKFGFYEFNKRQLTLQVGEETAKKWPSTIHLCSSAGAEFIADVFLAPMEAVKVKVQTTPNYAKGLSDGFPRFVADNGYGGLFKGLSSLWARQIPYTVIKFVSFERVVQLLYANVVPKPRSECSKLEQVGVSFAAGYIAGIACAIVSQPADNLVSKLNASKSATIGGVIRQMGMLGLVFTGLPMRIAMVGTLTGLQWMIYDAVKVAAQLPATGK